MLYQIFKEIIKIFYGYLSLIEAYLILTFLYIEHVMHIFCINHAPVTHQAAIALEK